MKAACVLARHFGSADIDYKPEPDITRWLEERLKEHHYDLIVGRYLRSTACSGILKIRNAPVILDLDDFDYQVAKNRLNNKSKVALKNYAAKRNVKRLEKVVFRLLEDFDHIWVTNETDLNMLGKENSSVLPNIPFVQKDKITPFPDNNKSNVILMVGSLLHPVNLRGIEAFIKNVWPMILKEKPQAEFRIVGRGMTGEQEKQWRLVEGVNPVGFVEDLEEQYKQCVFTVSPIFEGGGTKIKVLESFLYGRTCVISGHSQRGYEEQLGHMDCLWVGNDYDELAEGCIKLLNDPVLRQRMSEKGLKVVEECYTYDRFDKIVQETIQDVLKKSGKAILS
jgi:glycosyltransferase involved in cell wall biosynthesis